ncbi:MAG: glutathione S-transferase [Hahellaceae bacterium]|nr:glutathione S-transferase [Hahellaceae bacterium]MCP5168196.1 glutathione S-transferase [Hahellaceae bacterium]
MLPHLYSFRRCPYAIRARMAIAASELSLEIVEVALKNKPPGLLSASPKGTVPVLVLPNHQVIDESLDIMRWALSQNDPENWLTNAPATAYNTLINKNDKEFKPWLDRYKYADRYPEHDQVFYRAQAEGFIKEWDELLSKHAFLCGRQVSLADIAIFPFVRQFAHTDIDWFNSTRYAGVHRWLRHFLTSERFNHIMEKHLTRL